MKNILYFCENCLCLWWLPFILAALVGLGLGWHLWGAFAKRFKLAGAKGADLDAGISKLTARRSDLEASINTKSSSSTKVESSKIVADVRSTDTSVSSTTASTPPNANISTATLKGEATTPDTGISGAGVAGAAGIAGAAAVAAGLSSKSGASSTSSSATVGEFASEDFGAEPTRPDASSYSSLEGRYVSENVKVDADYGVLYDGQPSTKDDLQAIKGIGPAIEGKLNEDGVYRYRQIADWNEYNVWAFNRRLEFPGRIERDNWIPQAKSLLSSGGAVGAAGVAAAGVAGAAALSSSSSSQSSTQEYAPAFVEPEEPKAATVEAYSSIVDKQFAGEDVSLREGFGIYYRNAPSNADDLTKIRGIGDKTQADLNSYGVYRYHQIAHWNYQTAHHAGESLDLGDRVRDDNWISQAQALDADYVAVTESDQDSASGSAASSSSSSDGTLDLIGASRSQSSQSSGIASDSMSASSEDATASASGNVESSSSESSSSESGISQFEGENVIADPQLGICYRSEPSTADDLTQIRGIGIATERDLNEQGVYQIRQIAQWNDSNVLGYSSKLGLGQRISSEDWVGQARRIGIVDSASSGDSRGRFSRDYQPHLDAEFAGTNARIQSPLGIIYSPAPTTSDDLTRIETIDDETNRRLHEYGVFRFEQIALWDDDAIDGFERRLELDDQKIRNEKWVRQARRYHLDAPVAPAAAATSEASASAGASDEEEPEPETPNEDSYSAKASYYEGQPVKVDPKLGFIFTEAPPYGDDLTRIKGVGPVLSTKLNESGIYRFQQIADWNDYNVWAFNKHLSFPGRIQRDEWIAQATQLAKGIDPNA